MGPGGLLVSGWALLLYELQQVGQEVCLWRHVVAVVGIGRGLV
jgi:hypothetical protein